MQRSMVPRRLPGRLVLALGFGLLPFLGQGCGQAGADSSSNPMACDGRSDDTAALNAQLRTGRRIVLPAGTCVVDGAHFEGGKVDLHGSNEGQTTLRLPAGSPRDILTLINVTGTISRLGFDQLGAVGESNSLRIVDGRDLHVSQLRVANPNHYGVLFYGCRNCTLDGLTSTGGGTHGAWIVSFLKGNGNSVRNVSSVDAVNRTLVLELETRALVENISARDGVAETVLFDRTSHSVGRNWRYIDTKGQGLDDAFALLGKSEYNRIENVVADRPAGFGFTFAAQAKPEIGAPRFNEVYNLRITRPGQQLLSFTDDGAPEGPFCNVVGNLVGIDPNQQRGGNFPGLDFFGARENAVFGTVRSTDGRMTWGLVEIDNKARAGGNAFIGTLDAGYEGLARLVATEGKFTLAPTLAAAEAQKASSCALDAYRSSRRNHDEK